MGAVPVVVDFGGPGDTVHPEVGFKVPLSNENDVVFQIEKVLANLAREPNLLDRLRQRGMSYARENFTWDRKAQMVTQILLWAVGRGPKPDLPSPKGLRPQKPHLFDQ
jgi:glycosyltransferase involved in cell wall biosynthesis